MYIWSWQNSKTVMVQRRCKNKSILVVDDHEMFRDSLVFLIKKSYNNLFFDTGKAYATLLPSRARAKVLMLC